MAMQATTSSHGVPAGCSMPGSSRPGHQTQHHNLLLPFALARRARSCWSTWSGLRAYCLVHQLAKLSCHACSFQKNSKRMADILKIYKQNEEKTRQMEAVANNAPAATSLTEVQPIKAVEGPSLAEAAEMASDLMGQETEPETLHRVLVFVEVCWCLAPCLA